MPGFRTDLAMEAFDAQSRPSLPGVRVSRRGQGEIQLTEVTVEDDSAAAMLDKPRGRYLTLECPALRRRDPDARLAMSDRLTEALAGLLPAGPGGTLVIGLGNRGITPDALGPSVIDRILVTRHLSDRPFAGKHLRPVSAIAPGVLGITGIETMELVSSLAALVAPAVVICVDSLAARDSSRIGTTLQLTDAGIQPGAGVGNHRRALTEASVGAPVIAIGMPTVIHAATLARDAFDWLDREVEDTGAHDTALRDMEQALLGSDLGGMIVTPREIDSMIQDAADIIAVALNRALQPELTIEQINALMD